MCSSESTYLDLILVSCREFPEKSAHSEKISLRQNRRIVGLPHKFFVPEISHLRQISHRFYFRALALPRGAVVFNASRRLKAESRGGRTSGSFERFFVFNCQISFRD